MTLSLETQEALSALDELLEPGQRVPDAWEDLPLELKNWLKATLAEDRDIHFEMGFARFVQAYLVVYRQRQSEEEGGERRRREAR